MKTNNFFIFTLLLLTTLLADWARADEISVVDVRRNITLADEDPVYKDFYINQGEGSALRKNMVVTVKRKINVKDMATKSVGDFEAVVGQLKIIHVGNKVSVAREFKLTPRDEEPMLEQTGIMSGDRIDLKDSFIDNTKPVYRRKTSEAEPAKPEGETVKTADAGGAVTNPADADVKPVEATPPAREPAQTPVTPKTPEFQNVPVPQI